LVVRREVYRCRIDAEPLTGRLRAVIKHMAEVGATLGAPNFDPQHAVAIRPSSTACQ
jgi:hypothetical protein